MLSKAERPKKSESALFVALGNGSVSLAPRKRTGFVLLEPTGTSSTKPKASVPLKEKNWKKKKRKPTPKSKPSTLSMAPEIPSKKRERDDPEPMQQEEQQSEENIDVAMNSLPVQQHSNVTLISPPQQHSNVTLISPPQQHSNVTLKSPPQQHSNVTLISPPQQHSNVTLKSPLHQQLSNFQQQNDCTYPESIPPHWKARYDAVGRAASPLGLEVTVRPLDGNCFFSCVADVLRPTVAGVDIASLRKSLTDTLIAGTSDRELGEVYPSGMIAEASSLLIS
jgi:hypothetical protein